MKAFFFRLAIVGLMISQTYHAVAHVALDYPQGGETFIVGTTITIEWHIVAQHNTLNWDLFFSPDGGVTWDTIALDIPASLVSYEWEIPDILTSQGRVRIIQDNEDQNYLDNSSNFTIAPNTSPPNLDAPASDTTIQCSVEDHEIAVLAWLNNHGGAEATNYCGELIWTHDFPGMSNGCAATGSAEVTFTAMDDCGLITSTATVTIADTTPPHIEVQSMDIVVEADGQGNVADLQVWLDSFGGAQVADVCGNVIWMDNYSILNDGCGSTGSTTVNFIATDECGNSITTTATFTIEDHLPPNINIPAQNVTVDCIAPNQKFELQQWLDNNGGAQASDMGGQVIWVHNYSGLNDGCGSTGSTTVVFTATDECGNSMTSSASFTIEDTTAPHIDLLARDTTLVCQQANLQGDLMAWLENNGGAQASDFCNQVIWSNNFTNLSDGCGPTGMAMVIFIATDECGNSSTTTATIIIKDELAPIIDVEAQDTTIVCGQNDQSAVIQSWLNRQGGASASDFCGGITWANDFSAFADTCGPPGNHNITFTVIDECGHTTITNANLTIIDSLVTVISNSEQFNFIIYPNPSRDIITITFDQRNEQFEVVILFDAIGNRLWTESNITNEVSIPVHTFTSGVYFLHIKTSKGLFLRKVIVN